LSLVGNRQIHSVADFGCGPALFIADCVRHLSLS